MKSHRVNNFAELHKAFSQYRRSTRWNYRGHSNAQWSLIPKAGRTSLHLSYDLSMFRSWKRRAIEYINRVPDNELDWLALAQHHGLATRLLDWTINPLVATYFAVSGEQEGDAIVYAHYTSEFMTSPTVKDLEAPGVRRIRPTGVAARLLRQGGTFTLHSPPNCALDTALSQGDRLESVVVTKDYRKKLLFELSYYGFNEMTLFPDLDGLSRFVNWWTENRQEFADDEPFAFQKLP